MPDRAPLEQSRWRRGRQRWEFSLQVKITRACNDTDNCAYTDLSPPTSIIWSPRWTRGGGSGQSPSEWSRQTHTDSTFQSITSIFCPPSSAIATGSKPPSSSHLKSDRRPSPSEPPPYPAERQISPQRHQSLSLTRGSVPINQPRDWPTTPAPSCTVDVANVDGQAAQIQSTAPKSAGLQTRPLDRCTPMQHDTRGPLPLTRSSRPACSRLGM